MQRQSVHHHGAAAPCQHEALLEGAPDLDVLNFFGSTVIGSSERIVKLASVPGVMLPPSSSHLQEIGGGKGDGFQRPCRLISRRPRPHSP
jgi:hypothetical protein